MIELREGDLVETIRGAKFWGKIIGLHALDTDNPGAVVEAIDHRFVGTRHVYPLKVLALAIPRDSTPTEGGRVSKADLYYLRSIYGNLLILKAMLEEGPTLGSEALADNLNWLDNFIDEHNRKLGNVGS